MPGIFRGGATKGCALYLLALKSTELSAVFMESICLSRALAASHAPAIPFPLCRDAQGQDQRRRYFGERGG